jgi:hypothetical protein
MICEGCMHYKVNEGDDNFGYCKELKQQVSFDDYCTKFRGVA